MKKRKPLTVSQLKKKADNAFSRFIRTRDRNQCVLCKSRLRIQCGHLIKRGKMATRYDEDNCHALCATCNFLDQFEPQHYTCWFIKNYGSAFYERLVKKSRMLHQMKHKDFERIISYYTKQNEQA